MAVSSRHDVARELLVTWARELSGRGWLVAGLGALALRLDDGSFLLTPAGRTLSSLTTSSLRAWHGKDAAELGREAGTAGLLVELLGEHPRAKLAAFTQPRELLALSMAGVGVARCLLGGELSEVRDLGLLGSASPREQLLARLAAGLTLASDVLVERFGLLSVVEDGEALVSRLERLEHGAALTARARLLETAAPTSEESLAQLVAGLEAFGLRAGPDCARCDACSLGRRHSGAKDAFAERLDAAIGQHLARG